MKSLSAHIIKKSIRHTALVAVALGMGACDPILDNEDGDCTVRHHVTFKYDYNMLGVDAFHTQVECVNLYAFDADSTLAYTVPCTRDELATMGGRMEVPFDPRNYHLVAWCHRTGCTTTQLPSLACGTSHLKELTCRIGGRTQASDGCTEVSEIGPIFHGMRERDPQAQPLNPEDELNPTYQIPLMKNTNTLRIVLQNLSDAPLSANDFRFTIEEDNGLMHFDNTLLPDEQLTYVPFHTSDGKVDYEKGTRTSTSATILNMAVAEFSIGRLMADRRPLLTVSNRTTGHTVLSIPLTDYLKIARSQYLSDMSDQEYFDREDAYSITFFLNDDQTWMNAAILVNSWRVVLQDVDLD